MRDEVLREGLEAIQVSRLDILAFASAFVVGLASYFALRYAFRPEDHRQLWQTTAILACLIGYAIVVAKVPRLRVRLDQAGDNAYYLGLLFTLASMAVALYDFGQSVVAGADEKGTAAILSNFGVALASTIAGIFLRVVLHQMRVDPADVESMTRIELAEAAKRVKGTLDSVTVDMGRFHDDVRQRTEDVVTDVLQKARAMLGDFTTAVAISTTELMEKTGQAQRDITEQSVSVVTRMEQTATDAAAAIDRLRHVEAPPLKLANRLENVTGSLEALSEQVVALSGQIAGTGVSANEALANLIGAVEKLRVLTEQDRKQHSDGLREVETAVKDVKAELGTVGKVLATDVSLIRDLEEQSRRSAKLVESAHVAANDVLEALTESTKTLAAAIRQETDRRPG